MNLHQHMDTPPLMPTADIVVEPNTPSYQVQLLGMPCEALPTSQPPGNSIPSLSKLWLHRSCPGPTDYLPAATLLSATRPSLLAPSDRAYSGHLVCLRPNIWPEVEGSSRKVYWVKRDLKKIWWDTGFRGRKKKKKHGKDYYHRRT